MHKPKMLLDIVYFLGRLPQNLLPLGLFYEEATGNALPEEVGTWTYAVRGAMDKAGWKNGHLVVHIHEKWNLGDMTQLECLVNGANGIWASICDEGAALGHACSVVTIMNLLRMGNTKVIEKYNCKKFREAAIAVTQITTGQLPHPKKPIYGERALDLTFDFEGIAGGLSGPDEIFDINDFFGEVPPIRITTLSSENLIIQCLEDYFGENVQFTEEIARSMKETMFEDLRSNRKEEYMSEVGKFFKRG